MIAPTIGLALIARDEAATLPKLLQSIEGAFDRVVLVDTGSTDATKTVFIEWAKAQTGVTYSVGDFEWCDDFAAARIRADELLLYGNAHRRRDPATAGLPMVDWTCWADCDDTIAGATNLRQLAAQAPPELSAYVADYAYAHDEHGNCVCTLRRERLVRAGHGTWTGRVHEAQLIQGASHLLDPQIVRWVHHKPHDHQTGDRNLRILQDWVAEAPDDPRVLMYLGTESAARGLHEQALAHYTAYLALKTGWDEERAQVHRKLAVTLFALGKADEAFDAGLQALRVLPAWTDSYLTMAQAAHNLGEHAKAIEWANEVLRRGMPDSLLILNPLDYTFAPLQCLAAAHGALGHLDEAVAYAEQALAIVPDDGMLRAYFGRWSQTRKRNSTAQTFAACARLLVEHDEQLKALRLLEEAVPHYCTDHPDIVQLRSAVRERVRPLLDPATLAPEVVSDEAGTSDLDQVALLPRAVFLLNGLRDQATA